MVEGLVPKRRWPAPGSKVALGMAILFILLALFQALDALEATKTSSVVLHVVQGLILVAGSAFNFLVWRKGGDGQDRSG